MASLHFGDIVIIRIADPNGVNPKLRPALIVSPDAKLVTQSLVRVAAISSSQIPDPLPPAYFELPWHRSRHPKTGLDRRSVVKGDWLAEVDQTDVIAKIGSVSAAVALKIVEYLGGQGSGATGAATN